jgi:hypothetical protein
VVNESVRHGRITKHGPEELRTALVQAVMGMRRLKSRTLVLRLMERHEALKKNKGSGKSIIATARKVAVIIWHMLSQGESFDAAQMTGRKLAAKAEAMSRAAGLSRQAAERLPEDSATGQPAGEAWTPRDRNGGVKEEQTGVAGENIKKAG